MITLAEAKATMVDPVDQQVIDEFRRSSFLMDRMPFANDVAPTTGGATLVYGYSKLETPSSASFRKINGKYVADEAKRKRVNAYLKIMGGNFEIDRVLIGSSGALDELNFQMTQKIDATTNLFHYAVINGDSTKEDEFDGLKKLLKGASTEVTTDSDLSTSALMDTNYNHFLDEVTEFMGKLAKKPDLLLMNSTMKTKMKNVARRAGYYSQTEDAFGRSVDNWDGIPMMDMGEYYNAANSKTVPVVEIETDGTTAIYAVCFGLDAFHGVSLQGENVVTSHLPDLNAPGTVKEGDVEFVGCVALKNTLKAGVLKGIKVKGA